MHKRTAIPLDDLNCKGPHSNTDFCSLHYLQTFRAITTLCQVKSTLCTDIYWVMFFLCRLIWHSESSGALSDEFRPADIAVAPCIRFACCAPRSPRFQCVGKNMDNKLRHFVPMAINLYLVTHHCARTLSDGMVLCSLLPGSTRLQ